MNSGDKTTRTIVWAIVTLTTVVVVATVLLAVLAPDSEADVIGQVLGVLAPTLAVLATLRAVQGVKDDTHALTNGLLDAKVRAGVSEVVQDHLVDPSYREDQAREDRRVRDSLDPDL